MSDVSFFSVIVSCDLLDRHRFSAVADDVFRFDLDDVEFGFLILFLHSSGLLLLVFEQIVCGLVVEIHRPGQVELGFLLAVGQARPGVCEAGVVRAVEGLTRIPVDQFHQIEGIEVSRIDVFLLYYIPVSFRFRFDFLPVHPEDVLGDVVDRELVLDRGLGLKDEAGAGVGHTCRERSALLRHIGRKGVDRDVLNGFGIHGYAFRIVAEIDPGSLGEFGEPCHEDARLGIGGVLLGPLDVGIRSEAIAFGDIQSGSGLSGSGSSSSCSSITGSGSETFSSESVSAKPETPFSSFEFPSVTSSPSANTM